MTDHTEDAVVVAELQVEDWFLKEFEAVEGLSSVIVIDDH